jgi:hypothetical protein
VSKYYAYHLRGSPFLCKRDDSETILDLPDKYKSASLVTTIYEADDSEGSEGLVHDAVQSGANGAKWGPLRGRGNGSSFDSCSVMYVAKELKGLGEGER